MSKTVKVMKYSDQVVAAAAQMRREDYKAVKRMDKVQLVNYLGQIYTRGYNAGYKAAKDEATAADEEPAPEAAEE